MKRKEPQDAVKNLLRESRYITKKLWTVSVITTLNISNHIPTIIFSSSFFLWLLLFLL